MSRRIFWRTSSSNLYAVFLRSSDGKIWNRVNNAWETPDPDNLWNGTTSEYDVSPTSVPGSTNNPSLKQIDVPNHANFGAGRFSLHFWSAMGGTPDAGVDTYLPGEYDGTDGRGVDFWYDGANIVGQPPLYWAEVEHNPTVAGDDEYTVAWQRNGEVVAPTSPTIQVVKRSDGTDLIASTALTQVGSTAYYKRDESTNLMDTAEAYLVILTATIDGANRNWTTVIRNP